MPPSVGSARRRLGLAQRRRMHHALRYRDLSPSAHDGARPVCTWRVYDEMMYPNIGEWVHDDGVPHRDVLFDQPTDWPARYGLSVRETSTRPVGLSYAQICETFGVDGDDVEGFMTREIGDPPMALRWYFEDHLSVSATTLRDKELHVDSSISTRPRPWFLCIHESGYACQSTHAYSLFRRLMCALR